MEPKDRQGYYNAEPKTREFEQFLKDLPPKEVKLNKDQRKELERFHRGASCNSDREQ